MVRVPRLRFDRRQQAVVASAAVTGVVVGLVVAGFERLTDEVLLDEVLHAPAWAQAVLPAVGLAVAAVSLHFLARGATPATADEYVESFHERRHELDLAPVPGRLLAGVATIGSGGAMGLEGPSIYAGAAVGSALQRRLGRIFRREDVKLLLVAGAAAGVAAVFKAPATGVVFALEVPYRDDLARRALLPALAASATSYLVFVSIVGTTPLFNVLGTGDDFDVRELLGAAVVGVLAGLGARGFAALVHRAKHVAVTWPAWRRVAVAGVVLGGLTVLTRGVFEEPLDLGPGYDVFRWVAAFDRDLELIALLFGIRMAATIATVGGGGAGGLFIPLVVQGVLLGRFVAEALGQPGSSLFPVIGIAAFLGAGYRTPIASVMFVAETTGRAVFVVPALIAAAASQLLVGRASVSSAQVSARQGHLERRFQLPVSIALDTAALTTPPDATVDEFVWDHVIGRRQRSVPVLGDDGYLGMCLLDDISTLPRERWGGTTVEDVMRPDLPVCRSTWTLRDALAAMDDADVDVLAVVGGDGRFMGVVQLAAILELDEILDQTQPDEP